ncbi:hypothetical protein L1987_25561 [Smallanthus sonchifolius]|uniref:Uncharacterized protein n=1 Tax=Smallanthus sonchifolius TaxID=185202 RepID=A0ACB9I9M7_9ASTR|nr:hypothetical protein L1987_25561 [Smallanthus sonchifolius]
MSPSGGPIPPSKQPPDPPLEVPTVSLSSDSSKIDDRHRLFEGISASHPLSEAGAVGKSPPLSNGVQNRPSPYDRGSSGGATRRKGLRSARRENPQSGNPNFILRRYCRWGLGMPFGSCCGSSFVQKLEDFGFVCGQASQADTVTPSPAIPASAGLAAPGTSQASAGVVNSAAILQDADGFTIVNRKGKNKPIKLQKKKKQVVVKTISNGQKPIQRASISSGGGAKHGGNPTVSCPTGLGFNFARAVQGPKAKIFKPPVQDPSTKSQPLVPDSLAANSHRAGLVSSMEVDPPPLQSSNRFAALNDIAELDPFDQSVGTGTNFVELDIRASINRTTLVEASSNQSRPVPMQEDGPPIGHANAVGSEQEGEEGIPTTEKLVCQLNREHSDGARFLPASILSSPRLAVSNSICGEETVNWCPGEWDYFNDLCISLGLDPDYCIEDVESDTENGTAQFLSDLLNSGRPKSNHWRLLCYFGCGIWTDWDMGQQKPTFDWFYCGGGEQWLELARGVALEVPVPVGPAPPPLLIDGKMDKIQWLSVDGRKEEFRMDRAFQDLRIFVRMGKGMGGDWPFCTFRAIRVGGMVGYTASYQDFWKSFHSTYTFTKRGWTGLAFLGAWLLTRGDWNNKDRLFGSTREANDRRIDIWMNSGTQNWNNLHNSARTIVEMKTNFGKKDIDGRLDVAKTQSLNGLVLLVLFVLTPHSALECVK